MLVALPLSGGVLLSVVGHLMLLRIGLVAKVLVFAGIAVTGAVGNVGAFRRLVVITGFGTGLAAGGLLGGVATFAISVLADLLIGGWGTASLLGRAAGSLTGGDALDAARLATGATSGTYAMMFTGEANLLIATLLLTFRLKVEASRASREAHSG